MITRVSEEFIKDRIKNTVHPSFMETPFDEFRGSFRRAAVLIPLARVNDDWHVLYTRRTNFVDHHKGQVSFPGGRTDPDDVSSKATALRETFEEIGIQPEDVQILGALGEYLTVSNYLVTPFVGFFPWPYTFTIHTPEVERVFTIPLDWLADPSHRQDMVRMETGRGFITYLPYDGELLWGVTARITVSFLTALGMGASA
jgi:8-oxo-dGTP pyrophosphatase MutT (NUDIX family)